MRTIFLILFGLLIAAAVLLPSEVVAQNSLGLGNSEQAIRPTGVFAGILFWIQQQQQVFYKAMTAALSAMRSEPSNLIYLIGLSFLYGIFHAAGPGHGKAVISSYMLANEVAAKRGILLSFASAFLQGLTAITVIGLILLALRGTGIKTGNLAGFLETSSYFLVMILGLYLLWTKIFGRPHRHGHGHDGKHAKAEHAHHGHDCCGHSHAPDPKMLEGDPGLKEALSAIVAVGVRPCTGAIIVLTFAFLNSLYLGGILSTLAMSMGTGITVATLALLAVTAKNTAVRIAGLQGHLGKVHRTIEIFGAGFVFVIGLMLFSAAMMA